jgi:predicted nucleic acid-binding Zn ribbon protein
MRMEVFTSIADRHKQKCPYCDATLKKDVTVGVPHVFKPYEDWAMDSPPVRIESEKQKKRELEKRGLQPKC